MVITHRCTRFLSTRARSHVKNARDISLISVMITPCDSIPCTLFKGEMASLDISFTANADIGAGVASAHALYGGFHVRFPHLEGNVCDFVDRSCPIVAGSIYTFTFAKVVDKQLPSTTLSIRWELRDSEGNNFICIELPLQIGEPRSSFGY
ncbi:epididymal secretory protein E1 [Clonorchis sinensis]|uniref:Epididymal secretory protein E1 n=1 Tax=Clonorchis sinensis TaxID=79923 RepID=G7YNC4_CLOSI|nr:epididymal secretory protein E1 [Clonorchis sinensis]